MFQLSGVQGHSVFKVPWLGFFGSGRQYRGLHNENRVLRGPLCCTSNGEPPQQKKKASIGNEFGPWFWAFMALGFGAFCLGRGHRSTTLASACFFVGVALGKPPKAQAL